VAASDTASSSKGNAVTARSRGGKEGSGEGGSRGAAAWTQPVALRAGWWRQDLGVENEGSRPRGDGGCKRGMVCPRCKRSGAG
jgi:hypothetical protein